MEGVLGEDRRKSLRVLNWAIRLTQTIRSQPRGSCLASSPLLGTNGRLARWGNSRPPISPPRARPVIQRAVENGCALAFSAGALVNFPAPVSLAQREFGLPDRDCRTTKMRERDARAAIAANAAQIRLCVKTFVARLAQSPGTSG